MSESETSKKIREVVKLADKLIQDLMNDVTKLREAARELRKDEEEKRK